MAAYVSTGELEAYGLNARALESFTEEQKEAAILAASDEVDRYVGGRVGTPLAEPIPLAVKSHVARMAVFNLLSVRGIDPEADRIIVDNYNRAIAFLTNVAKGVVMLGPSVTAPIDDPTDDHEGAEVFSDIERGYPRGWV